MIVKTSLRQHVLAAMCCRTDSLSKQFASRSEDPVCQLPRELSAVPAMRWE